MPRSPDKPVGLALVARVAELQQVGTAVGTVLALPTGHGCPSWYQRQTGTWRGRVWAAEECRPIFASPLFWLASFHWYWKASLPRLLQGLSLCKVS